MPYGGPGVHASEPQPFMQGVGNDPAAAALQDQAPTEGGADTNFNPSDAAQEDMLGEGASEVLLVTDCLISFLSILIANGQYSIDDVMNELSEVFTNEGSTAEFRGALKEHAEQLAKGSTEEDEEPSDDNIPDINSPEAATAFGGPGSGGLGPEAQEQLGVGEPGMKTSSIEREKDELLNYLLAERSMRLKLASRVDWVREHMQNRGPEGTPLVPSVDYLVSVNGLSKEAAVEAERKATYHKAAELVQLDEDAWGLVQSAILSHPLIDSVGSQNFQKVASVQSGQGVPIYLTNDSEGSHKFDFLPEALFETRHSSIARQENAKRKSTRSVKF